jgi:diacylglycerol kinase (ATP)
LPSDNDALISEKKAQSNVFGFSCCQQNDMCGITTMVFIFLRSHVSEYRKMGLHPGKTVFVVNPHSGNGKTGKEWPRIRKQAEEILGTFESYITTGPGDATVLTGNSLRGGADVIVCVGGDGTLNEVINGFFDNNGPIHKDAVLGFLPNGTGCDFPRSFPVSSKTKPALESIRNSSTQLMDLGYIHFKDHQGNPRVRYFHNITSCGLGGEVVERVNRASKAGGPFLTFIVATLTSLLKYKKKTIRIRIDDKEEIMRKVLHVAVANGRYQGGGMQVAPEALFDDGLLDVTVIDSMSIPLILRRLPNLYNGKIKQIPQVSSATARKVSLFSDKPVLIDVDGEQPGILPAEVEIIPEAIRMIVKS